MKDTKKRIITDVHDTGLEIIGECEGRLVKWTWAIHMWYFADTGEYIDGEYEQKYRRYY